MYWDREILDKAIERQDFKLRNFFSTFGFIVIRNFLPPDHYQMLSDEYYNQYKIRWTDIIPPPALAMPDMQFLPNFVDSSEIFTEYFFSAEIQKVYRYFAGDQFLYLGSDGSHFIRSSFPWHRDWFTRIPLLKFNFYFNEHAFTGGDFMIIPGSQCVGDQYASAIQKGMAWPLGNKEPGGLYENGWFPKTANPRSRLAEQKELPEIPHVSLRINQGDVIIFDHRAVHCVQTTEPLVPRRLLTVLLSRNAFEMGHPEAKSMMKEIVDLAISERNHIGCPAYGDAIYNHPFSKSQHFIAISKSGDKIYDLGKFGSFQSLLDEARYAAIGAAFRLKNGNGSSHGGLEQTYGYKDVHLGINAQNMH